MTSSQVVPESVPDASHPGPEFSGKGLRARSIGLASSVTLGLSSVAPAYSIAVTLGFVVMVVGKLAPGGACPGVRADAAHGIRLPRAQPRDA